MIIVTFYSKFYSKKQWPPLTSALHVLIPRREAVKVRVTRICRRGCLRTWLGSPGVPERFTSVLGAFLPARLPAHEAVTLPRVTRICCRCLRRGTAPVSAAKCHRRSQMASSSVVNCYGSRLIIPLGSTAFGAFSFWNGSSSFLSTVAMIYRFMTGDLGV